MKDLHNGISYYTKATVVIGFPEDRICCEYCPMLETYARRQCRKTGEYLTDVRGIGFYCPLKFEEDNNE